MTDDGDGNQVPVTDGMAQCGARAFSFPRFTELCVHVLVRFWGLISGTFVLS